MLIHKPTLANVLYLDPSLLAADVRPQIDVVEQYHRRNRFPRAPDPQQLREVNQCPPLDCSSAPVTQDAPEDGISFTQPNMDGFDATEQIPTPLGELSGSATKLRSYPHKFREIIERAKQLAQCGAATDPFPVRSWFVEEKSAEYITEAIAEREAKHVYIPPGESFIAS